jgi:hypothetical protein
LKEENKNKASKRLVGTAGTTGEYKIQVHKVSKGPESRTGKVSEVNTNFFTHPLALQSPLKSAFFGSLDPRN